MKRTVAPHLTRSMKSALVDLKLTKLFVIHAGNDVFPLAQRVTALPFERVLTEIESL